MFLAGTVIFGGRPIVAPLLREYVVAEGWVSSRDFLLGLAAVQALSGPNFDFAAFLGSLTISTSASSASSETVAGLVGALAAWLAIFAPGMVLIRNTLRDEARCGIDLA